MIISNQNQFSTSIGIDRTLIRRLKYRDEHKNDSKRAKRMKMNTMRLRQSQGSTNVPCSMILISMCCLVHTLYFPRNNFASAFMFDIRTRHLEVSQIKSDLHHGRKGRIGKGHRSGFISAREFQLLLSSKSDEAGESGSKNTISKEDITSRPDQKETVNSETTSHDKTENLVNSRKLSKQEELIASLGLGEVETEEDKARRIAKREAALRAQESEKLNNIILALASVTFAILQYIWQFTHPVTAIQLLSEMQRESPPVSVIGRNGKPSVVDFWAPWCENCKAFAPTLQQVEQEFGNKINFIMINGDEDSSWNYIEAFGVDAIPHLALVSAEGDVETALIGPVPASVLRTDFNTLLENASKSPNEGSKKPLPYVMYDAFRTNPEKRRVSFSDSAGK